MIRRSSDFDVANLKSPPTTPETKESRRMAGIDLRLPLFWGMTFEIEEAGGHQIYGNSDRWTWSDVATRLTIPLWESRYSGVSLVLGALQPIGDVHDWSEAHGSWTVLAGLRATVGIGQFVLGADAEAGYCPWARNKVENTTGDLDKEWIDHVYFEGHGGGYVTYRLARWVRVGAAQKFDYRHWSGAEDWKDAVGSFSAYQAPTVGLLELDADTWCRFQGYCGADFLTHREGYGASDTITAGVSVVMTW